MDVIKKSKNMKKNIFLITTTITIQNKEIKEAFKYFNKK